MSVTVKPASITVISLSERVDRRTRFTKQWSYPFDYSFFDALAGDSPAIGCFRSHTEVLNSVPGPALVFEDDAVLAPDFSPVVEWVPDNWDILWLGGEHTRPPRQYNKNWTVPVSIQRTHAYIAREPQRLAEMLDYRGFISKSPGVKDLKQYALTRFTVGQSAGRSDISKLTTEFDSFWH